jgi:CBS domain-containing protein
MLALRDLMTPAPVTITPGATLRDAVELLTKVGVNALPVTNGGEIVGVLTAQSIIAFESTTPGVPTERHSSDVWESEPPEDEDLPTAAYFTDLWEDAGSDLDERFRVSDSPEWDFLSEHLVEEAMVPDPPQFPPDAMADEAAERMRETGAHGVLVVDAGKLCGIVTTMDITRAFAEQSPTELG